MEAIQDILETQFQLMEAIQKFLDNFKKDGADRKTPEKIERRLQILDQYWADFQANHDELRGWEESPHAYFTEKQFEVTKQFYLSTKEYVSSFLKQEKKPTAFVSKKPSSTKEVKEQESSNKGQAVAVPSTSKVTNTHGENSAPVVPDTPLTVTRGSSSKTEEMLRKQASNFKAFSRTASNINMELITEKWEFEDILKALEARWIAIDALHWEIDSLLESKNIPYEMNYNTYELQYNKIKKDLNTKMWSVSHREKSTPKMEIPNFSGSYQHWTSFKDLFTEAIHANPSLPNGQKMQFLKSKVKGEAEKLIQHLLISSDNYQTCWDILNHRYNNKKMIFSSHLSVLLNLPNTQPQTSASVKRIHDTTNECLHAIKNLGVNIVSWDPILVHLLSQKLDAETHNDYVESLKAPRELPTLDEFLEFLENKFTSLESSRRKPDAVKSYQHHQEQSVNNKKYHSYKSYSTKQDMNLKPYSNNSFIKPSNTNNDFKCPHCQNDHKLFACKRFLELRADAKRELIAKYNLCKNCLFDHKGKECYSIKRCRVCNETHNTLLHDAYSGNPKPSTSNNQSRAAEYKKPNNNISSHVSQEDLSEILLATAIIKVQAANKSQIVLRALIDQGSQTSLITEKAAQLLRLPRGRCNGTIFGVGAKENNCKGVISITCTSAYNDFTFTTDTYIMRNLINSLPNKSFIYEYQSLNHMVECTSNKTPNDSLPHHCVQRAESATTALRVVFNASAKTTSGYTLNDLMKRGPNLQQDLMSLILRWRQYQYAYTADIEKMFRQILINRDHQQYQKIIWRPSPEQLLREYQLTTVTYGTKAAPFLAMMTLKQLAMDEGYKYLSRAAEALKEEFYMDDLVSGSFTMESAKQLQNDLISLLKSGGFNLRKWSSNKVELLEHVSTTQTHQEAFDFKQQESTKTLGLKWHQEQDQFIFKLNITITPATDKHTKRSLLSDISKIFDPLGWLSPIITKLSKPIYLDRTSSMQVIHDEWKLIVYYDMNPYWDGLATFEKYVKRIKSLCEKDETNIYCDIILTQLRHNHDEVQYYNSMLLNQRFESHLRSRRGLVDGVGYIANSLFGVLDQRFADQYQKDISLIKDNQKHQALLWKNQTSVVEAEYNLLKRTEETINTQHKIINKHLNRLTNATNTLNKEVRGLENITELTLLSFIANNMLVKLKSVQDTLLDTLTDLHHGMFNIHLISPEQLREELNIISGQLSRDLSLPVGNIQTEMAKIYHLLKIKARATEQYLIFEIKIPLVSRDNFELYKILTVPYQQRNATLHIIPTSDYIAINLRKDTYLEITNNELQQCLEYDDSSRLCHSQKPIFHFKPEESLCVKNQITDKCQTRITACHNSWTELSKRNSYLYYYCEQTTLRVICEDQITAVQTKGAGVIALAPTCVIKGKDFTVVPRKIHRSEMKLTADIYTPEIAQINHIINVSVPLSEINTTDSKAALEQIKQQIQQMKSETALKEGVTYHDVHQFTVIYIILAGAIIAVAAVIWRRVNKCRSVGAELQPEGQQPPQINIRDTRPFPRDISRPKQEATQAMEMRTRTSFKAKQNKATSPVFNRTVFTGNENPII